MNTSMKKQLVLGIFAHVDAGKTTLSEALLYTCGAIRTRGRVDHGDAFLDNGTLERQRGITIFSKQARFETEKCRITLLDTPGHTDFSAEAERTVQILDYAVLVISGTDGVQPHTRTLWQMLRRSKIPTFIFINKTDLPGFDERTRMAEVESALSSACVDFTAAKTPAQRAESAAGCDEALLEDFVTAGTLTSPQIAKAVADCRLFPCCFGSALHMRGIDELINIIDEYSAESVYPQEMSARVYKISHDGQGNRLTHIKVTGGVLNVRDALSYLPAGSEEKISEKISQIRLYSGAKYDTTQSVAAGEVCTLLGLSATYPGQGLGAALNAPPARLEGAISYRILPPPDCDAKTLLPHLRKIEEEYPQLHITWDEHLREIRAQLAGKIETEVLCHTVEEQCGIRITVDSGKLLYRETIAAPVVGVGHFEPLRHYAEVVVRIEPAERGSGITVASTCPQELLSPAWEQTVLTKLARYDHRGVLTGAPLCDVRIVLLAGRAHPKHTEGADFREAARRAVRQALMQAENILLEPMAAFRLCVPFEQLGRAIGDLHGIGAEFSPAQQAGESMEIRGRAALGALRGYAEQVAAYTHGAGRITFETDGYASCREQEKIVAESGYNPMHDTENPADSVFCAHGAGVLVPWQDVPQQMHLMEYSPNPRSGDSTAYRVRSGTLSIDERELAAIFAREFGTPRQTVPQHQERKITAPTYQPPKKEYLIVDGYNVVFAWESLRTLAASDFDAARSHLLDMLVNYSAYKHCETVCVFDAYRVSGHRGEHFDYHNIHVVYTSEGETGDLYIERLVNEIGKNDSVRVITSDGLIQLSALRSGVLRVSAREFEIEMRLTEKLIRDDINTLSQKNRLAGKNTIMMPSDINKPLG